MLKKSILFIFSIIIFSVNSCDNGTTPTNYEYNSWLASRFDKIGDSLVSDIIVNNVNHSIPGAVIGVIHPDNKFTYLSAFGKSEIITGEELFRADRIRIGDITQSFVAILTFRLIDDGKIKIDAPINTYINVPHSGSLITVRHLLSSRSGLADFTDSIRFYQEIEPNKVWTNSELVDYSFKVSPLNYPDKVTNKTNIDFLLLSMIIENVTGENMESLIKNRILNILNLSNTGFPKNAHISGGSISHGYKWSQQNGYIDYTAKYDYSWTWGSANMVSNAHDLLIWADALGTGRLISNESFNIMRNFQHFKSTEKYDVFQGLGMMKIGTFLGFSGNFDGYYTSFYYLPSRKTIIYIFTNTENDNDDLMVKIAQILMPDYKFK